MVTAASALGVSSLLPLHAATSASIVKVNGRSLMRDENRPRTPRRQGYAFRRASSPFM
jgi:hypothetical protein